MSLATILGIAKGAASWWREIVIGILLLGVLWFRGEARACEAARAADDAARAKAILEFQIADAERTRALEDAHAAELERIRSAANERHEAIARAPSSTACLSSPAYRAFRDGLRKPADAGAPPATR